MAVKVQSLVAFAGLAVCASAHAETWANNLAGGTQPWGTGTNWVGGVSPISDINTALVFNYNFSSTLQTSQNGIGAGTFNLNSLMMNNESAGGLTISALALANTLTFNTNGAALAPSITNTSGVAATISAGLVLANQTDIMGAGNGNLTLSGIIAGAGGLNLSMSGLGVVSLTGINTYTGNTFINSGNVSVGNAAAFGAAANTVTVNGGSLRFSAASILAQNFVLNSDLNLTGIANGTFAGIISGSGGIRLRPLATTAFTFTGNNTFTGAYDSLPPGNLSITTTLSGAGAFSNVGAIRLTSNQTMSLDNSGTNNNNRLNDAAGITLNRANLLITGNAAGTTETVGAITYTGMDTLAVTPNASGNMTLTTASLNRANNGTLVFQGTNLGGSGANSSNVLSTASLTGSLVGGGGLAGSTNISVLTNAYAVNTVGTASGQLVTYDNTAGVRPLTNAEYVGTLTGIRGTTSNNNVKTGGAVSVNKGTTMNALVVDSASAAQFGAGVYGSTFLTPSSGVLMFSISGGATVSTLPSIATTSFDFGAQEAIIHAQNNGAITGVVSGFGGLTKSGGGQVLLSGANNITGSVTVNAGSLAIASNAALGDPTNSLVLSGGNVSGINFAPSDLLGTSTVQSLTMNRNISLVGAGGGLQATLANTTFTESGVISGSGAFFSGVLNLGNTGTVKLTGNNTYTGPTVVFGNLAVNSDANLGAGTDITMTGGYLRNDGALTTSKNLTFQAGASLVTNGFDMTLNGQINAQAAALTITKGGTNTLTLTNNNAFNGSVQIGQAAPLGDQDHLTMGGSVVLNGNGSLNSATAINVLSGSSLILDNTGTNLASRVNANVNVAGGTLEFRGNGSAASSETIGTLTAGNFSPAVGNGAGIVTLTPGAGQSAVVTASGFARTGAGAMLVRGTNLGGAIGANTANLVFNTAPTLTNGILAGVVGDDTVGGAGSGFVTHVAGTGLRLLTGGEYSAMPTSGVTTVNADVTSANVLSGATSVNSMRIGAGGGVDATGQTLTVTSGMILANGGANSGIVGGTMAFGTAPATIWANSNLAVSSIMTGSGGLNKAGGGNLTLTGASTLTGGAIISNGTLTYGVANALGTANALTLGTSGSAVGTLDLNGFAGTFASVGGFGNISLGGATLTTAGGSTLFSGSITGSGNVVANGSMTLAGVSSFSGNFTMANSGTLTISANQPTAGNGPLGSSGTLILGDGTNVGSLSVGNNIGTMNKNIVVAANASASFPTFNQNAGSNVMMGGTITLNRGARLSGGSTTAAPYTGSMTLAGDISGVGGFDWFGGNFNLWGNNTFAGNFNMESGLTAGSTPNSSFLGIGSNTALGAGSVTIGPATLPGAGFGGGSLRADNGARSLANNFLFTANAAGSLGFSGVNDLTLNGQFDLGGGNLATSVAAARTFEVLNAGNTTLMGVVSGAAASTLTKVGGGRLVMGGANTFAGNVTVSGGSLIVNGSNSGAGTYTVNANSMLGGSGSIAGAVTITANAFLEPGNSPGALATGALTLNAGSFMMWELGDSTNPGASDRVDVTGNLSFAGGAGAVTLNIQTLPGFLLLPGSTTWTIATYTGTLTGGAANIAIGPLPSFVTSAVIDTTSAPGQVLLTLVPTPGVGAIFGMAGLAAFRRRRVA